MMAGSDTIGGSANPDMPTIPQLWTNKANGATEKYAGSPGRQARQAPKGEKAWLARVA